MDQLPTPRPVTPLQATPPQLAKATTLEERVACKTLYFKARWSYRKIAEALDLSLRQVQYAISAGRITPQHRKKGRHGALDTPEKQLIILSLKKAHPLAVRSPQAAFAIISPA
jgi:hypothetical protein